MGKVPAMPARGGGGCVRPPRSHLKVRVQEHTCNPALGVSVQAFTLACSLGPSRTRHQQQPRCDAVAAAAIFPLQKANLSCPSLSFRSCLEQANVVRAETNSGEAEMGGSLGV